MVTKAIFAAIALCAAAVNAHISLAEPIPYGKPDTSPLSPAGSNYPCKTENGFKVNSVTKMTVGSSQKMAFSGTAVHGGGSCQISLATGHTPTAASQFKVIYSIMGGCPGTDGSTVNYDFKVPAEVPAGEYTLAWTWFNRIGNREMYMNCAPITVDGGSGSDSTFSSLPDMAIYNIASKNACSTTEGTDVAFPNPGKYVLTGAGNKPGPPANCGASSASSSSGSGSGAAAAAAPASGSTNSGASAAGSANTGQYTGIGSSSGNSGAAAAGSASSPASAASSAPKAASSASSNKKGSAASSSASKPSSAASGSAGTFAEGSTTNGTTGGTSNGASTGSDSSAASAPASLSTPTPAAAAASPVTPTSSDGGACSSDGAVVCSSDGTQFGLCNFGKAVMMPVAAGTKCAGGKILRRRLFTS